MAYDVFLKIDGVPGESVDDKHRDWMEVLSFVWGESYPGVRPGNAIGTAKPVFQSVSLRKRVDRASPKLMTLCAAGTGLKTCVLEVRSAAQAKPVIYGVRLSACNIISVKTIGLGAGSLVGESADENLIEEVGVAFQRLEIAYRAQRPDGSLDAAGTGAYDLARSRVFITKSFLT